MNIQKRLKAYAKNQDGWHNIDDICEEATNTIDTLVYYINCLVEGEGDDCIEALSESMRKFGFWDEDGFPIESEDE
jgi:hypothetical protein